MAGHPEPASARPRPPAARSARSARRSIALLAPITFLAAGGWATTMSFLSSFAATEFDVGILSAALIMIAVHGGSFTVGGALALQVVNRWGSKVSYVLGMGLMAAYLAFLGLTQNLILGIPFGLVGGLGLAMHWTGLQNYVLEVAPPRHRGLVSGTVSFVLFGSIGVTGLVLGYVTGEGGFARFMAISGSMMAVAFLLSLKLLPNLGARAGVRPPGNVFAGLRDPNLRQMSYVRTAHAAAYVLFNLMAGPRLYEAGGGLEYVGLLAFAGSMAGGVAQLMVGWLSDLFGRAGLLMALLALTILSCISFIFLDNVYLLLAVTSLHWFAQSAFQTVLVPLGGDLAPPGQSANAMALQTVAFSFGLVAGAFYVGLFSITPWPEASFVLTAVLLATVIPPALRLRAALAGTAALR